MRLESVKRILVTALCVALVSSDFIPAFAEVVGGENVTEEATQLSETSENISLEVVEETTTEVETLSTADLEEESTVPETEAVVEGTTVETSSEISTVEATETISTESTTVEMTTTETATEELTTEEVTTEEPTTEELSTEEMILEKEVDGVVVQLKAPAGVLPVDATLSVKEISSHSLKNKDVELALDEKTEENAEELQSYRAFDIKIISADGKEIQPTDDVVVSFTGDLLLPKTEEEKVTVYHIDENAIATEVTSAVVDQTVEMTTNHFSVYAVATTKSLAQTIFDINIGHYLAEDFGKTVAERTPFYENDEMLNVEAGSLAEIPVQGGDDYEIVKFVITNGETVVEKTGDEIVAAGTAGVDINGLRFIGDKVNKKLKLDLDEINTAAKEVTVELFYQPLETEHYNPVTAFDYSIVGDTVVKEEKNLSVWYDIVISCEYNGKTYDSLRYRNGGLIDANEKKVVSFKEGTYLYNVKIMGDNQIYDKVLFKNASSLWYSGFTKGMSAVNAGINRYGIDSTNYLAMGQTGSVHKFSSTGNSKKLNVNVNNAVGGANPDKAIIPGLVSGLTADYTDIIATVDEPGYFNAEPLEGKTIYDDRFDLKFSKNGHKYSLISAIDKVSGRETLSDKGQSKSFFPLNDVERNDTIADIEAINGPKFGTECLKQGSVENNCFYGLRYDFKFTLGDYIGPLQYTFVGDDDLWVFMDGELVLDLGGLHQPYPVAYSTVVEPNTVDLWQFIKDESGNYDKTKEHQITVMFMERGAWDSSCYMEFTLPDAAPMDSIITDKPKGNIEFTKVDEAGTALEGAVFEAYRRITSVAGASQDTFIAEATSDANGKVRFTDLKEGNYIIREVKAPEGYILNPNEFAVTVVGNQTVSLESGVVVNEKEKTIPFEFVKVDAETKEPIAGVTFELFKKDEVEENQNQTGDHYTQSLGTAVSDANGKVVFKDLVAGDYLLKEVAPAEGYFSAGPWIVKVIKVADDLKVELYKEVMVGDEEKPEAERFYIAMGEAAKEMVIENIKQGPELGKLTITKQVYGLDLAFGAPTFSFKIEGPEGLVLYRTITFEDDSTNQKSITIINLPVGTYKVTELSTLRYQLVSPTGSDQKEVKAKENTEFLFINELKNRKRYSHSDVVVNGFRKNENGEVEIYQDREVHEEVEELITDLFINDKALLNKVVDDTVIDNGVEE